MAYLQQDKEDEEKVQGLNQVLAPQEGQPAVGTAASQPSSTPAPTPAPSAPASASPAQPGQVNQKAGSGTFTNLKNYLTANQGNRVASAATQKVSNLATGAQKGITQASTGFGQKVDQGTLANRGQAVQDVQATTAAARGVEAIAPAPAPAPVVEGAPAAPEATTAAQPQYLDESQQKRFADVINAKYSGPESLRQSGLLQPAAEKVTTAARQIKNAETAGGREELLRSMYGKNRDYTQGQSKLDSLLLNTSEQGVTQLQQAAKAGENLQQNLQQAEAGSQNLAQNRAQEIASIRDQARGTFESGRTAEEAATEKRMDDLIKTPVLDEAGKPVLKQDGTPMTEWDKLPEHFRASLANKASGAQKVKSEKLAELNTQYAPQIKAVADATSRVSAAENQIKNLQKQLIGLNRLDIFGTSPEGVDPKEEALKLQLSSQLAALQNQTAQQKSQIAATKQSPEYKQYAQQKAAAEGMNMNQWALSPEEAAVLGISSGEGLYNIDQGDIKTTAADREKLITQNEFARQQALSQLAGLDLSQGLQKELKYKDQAKAGTQDLTKSLDTDSFRKLLNEAQQGFKESAEGANITGTGKKKVSRGNAWGKKTSTYHASVAGNAADMLKQAGYDVGAEGSGARSLLSDKDMLANYLGATNTNRAIEAGAGGQALEGTTAGATTGAGIGAMTGTGPVGALIGAGIGGVVGGTIGSNTIDPFQRNIDMMRDFEDKLGIKGAGAVAQGYQDIRNIGGKTAQGVANMVGGSLGKAIGGVGSAISGIDTGAMKAMGSAVAKQKAIEDLQNKYKSYLQGQGFENRANIADTETTRARTAALNQLLQRKG